MCVPSGRPNPVGPFARLKDVIAHISQMPLPSGSLTIIVASEIGMRSDLLLQEGRRAAIGVHDAHVTDEHIDELQ